MATRSIVTYQPDVACDVCGRRLLRGERPDTFIAAGRRRIVCELCVPRATGEGWLREADAHTMSLRTSRTRSARSLIDRLRQLRGPAPEAAPRAGAEPVPAARRTPRERPLRRRSEADEEEYEDGFLQPGAEQEAPRPAGLHGSAERRAHEVPPGSSAPAAEPDGWAGAGDGQEESWPPQPWDSPADEWDSTAQGTIEDLSAGAGEAHPGAPSQALQAATSGDAKAQRALSVFNSSQCAARVAGIARALGQPSVTVRPLGDSGSRVAIVVAWELCWYRYEVDLGDELSGPQLVSEGMELDELPAEDRVANAAADERGELSLVL